ncbi:SusC/RagA family TonB-linked outer membrane protein [Seramator thermalis]|uniref:SusC/RagA family TonB-linked outer membrane protein n=1 Tax=Seramator thermalis TaxID=2496270 RepID=UPI0013ED1E01|nr:TonB-dependent receptor [Seramator thermalis]
MYILFCTISLSAFAQNIKVTGKVTDNTGEAIIGANVTQKGTTIGTATDIDGNFTLNVPGNATLVVSFLGYIPQEINVNDRTNINITLLEDVQALEEVVVTGYGTQRKATLTGSISSINSEKLTITKNENVVNMLAGKMPGLRITQRSSQPGQYNTVIDVRGFGEPLFVIDGVARSKDDFARMNPEEIESISLLKDASAAIYGIRAANGVMLITTKSGTAQNGKVDVSYSGNVSMQEMLFIPGGYTVYEWKMLRNEQNYRDFNNMYFSRKSPIHSDEELAEALNAKEYNWQEKVFNKLTPQTQHNMSVNGGTETLRYFFSLGYLKQDGSYASGSLWSDKYNLRTNVDAKISDRLSMRVSLGAIIGAVHEPAGGLWDNYKQAFLVIPGTPFYANDNPDYLNGYTPWNNEFTNLIGKMDEKYAGYTHRKDRRMNGSLSLNYDIPGVKGLSASAFYDYYENTPDTKTYKKMYETYKYIEETDSYVLAKLENGPNNTVTRSASYSTGTTLQLALAYQNTFGDHNVDGKIIHEEIYSEWDNFNASRILKLNAEDLFAGETNGQTGSGGTPGDRSQSAYIGRMNYDYAGKYMLSLIGRYEGNSRWPANKRWGFFPSVAVAWRLSEENFIKNNFDFVSNLKLRASYGKLGDEANAGNYPEIFVGYQTHGDFGWIYSKGTPTQGVRATAIPNLQKTWIEITSQNVALDFGFLRNKISGTFDLFRRDRDGLMATNLAVIPGTVGANLPQVNMNSDRYYGWEFELAYRDRIEGFNYSVSGQISSTRRKWLYLQETPASNSYDHWRNRYNGRFPSEDMWWSIESKDMFTSIEEIRNFTTYPIGQATLPGDWYLTDWNGDGIIDGGDSRPMATKGLPYFNYGFTLAANYKGFDLAAHFQGAQKVYMDLSEVFTEPLPFGGQNSLNWFLDRWHPVDPNADYWHPDTEWIPGYYPLTGGGSRRENSNAIMDASYVRLKTLELGYSMPKSLLAKAKIKDVRIYLNGYNLLTFSKLDKEIDPERPAVTSGAGGSPGGAANQYVYPNNKTYTVGVSFKF